MIVRYLFIDSEEKCLRGGISELAVGSILFAAEGPAARMVKGEAVTRGRVMSRKTPTTDSPCEK